MKLFEKTLTSETKFEGRIIKVLRDTVELENGKTSAREVVCHNGGVCVAALLKKVGEYAGRMDMITVPFTEIQEQIRDNCPEELATVIMRRFMMRAAERIARERECSALITGESLGQVASQTIQAIACTDAAANMPVFRPLIGSDKSEIVTLAHRIDTYDISIEPYEDCCTVFTPKHPRTRPTLNVVEAAEQKLDVEQLLKNCLEKTEIRHL